MIYIMFWFRFSAPKDWNIVKGKDNFFTIEKDTKIIGEIFLENIPPEENDILFSLKPSIGDVYYTKILKDYFTEAAIFKFKRSYNEGNNRIMKDFTEIGFVIDKKKGTAIKLIAENKYFDEKVLLEVTKSFNNPNG